MKTLAKVHSSFSPIDDDEVKRPRPIGDDDDVSTGSHNVLLSALIILLLCFSLVLMITFSMVATAYADTAIATPMHDGVRPSVAILHRQAVLAYDEGRYHDALHGLLEVHATDPDNLSVQHLIGRCLLYGLAQPEMAIPYLQQASARVSATYDRWALDHRDAPTTTLFDLGKAYELSGQYPEAKGAYTLFLGHLRPSKGVEGRRMYTNVVRGIEACDLQMEARQSISMSAPATQE